MRFAQTANVFNGIENINYKNQVEDKQPQPTAMVIRWVIKRGRVIIIVRRKKTIVYYWTLDCFSIVVEITRVNPSELRRPSLLIEVKSCGCKWITVG